ncbi:MAG: hypothetical protein KatS3mg065_0622 [Chloroflexota bacterium]|nr:MAG: hypothetical protein KatS3mg065_0622 [Chloroflexota bacterium]
MAVGLLEERHLTRAIAPGPGNLAVLFGSTTGRDGIGGASVLASATFSDEDPSKRPSVQVGDPFAEKLLIEASLELIEAGLVEGSRTSGAGGITCATSETADRAGTGMIVDLDAVPRREEGMTAAEVLISESQERMLAIVRPERLAAVAAVCEKWGLPWAVIGRVTDDRLLTVVEGGLDADGRRRRGPDRRPGPGRRPDLRRHRLRARSQRRPARRRAAPAPAPRRRPSSRDLPERGMDPGAVLLALLGSPNLASRRWVYEQYDQHVMTNTVEGPGRGAAVLRIKGTRRGLVASTDANQAIGAIDPYLGAVFSVAEAARNVPSPGPGPSA